MRPCFQDPRWYPLLSSKYTKQRPELLLSLQLENDAKPSEPSPDRFKAKKAPPRQGLLTHSGCFVFVLITTESFTRAPTHLLAELGNSHLMLLFPSRSSGAGSSAVTDLLPGHMEALLIPEQGYYQVGPVDHCTDMFLLSVTLAFATKLEQVRTVVRSNEFQYFLS